MCHPSDPQVYVDRAAYYLEGPPPQGRIRDFRRRQSDRIRSEQFESVAVKSQHFDQPGQIRRGVGSKRTRQDRLCKYFGNLEAIERHRHHYVAQARALENEARLDPNLFWQWDASIAVIYAEGGDFQEALRYCEDRAASADGIGKAQWWKWQARCLVALGRNKEAIEMATKALSVHNTPFDTSAAYSYRAMAYFNLGQYERAVLDSSQGLSLSLEPLERVRTLKLRATSFEKLGQRENADSDFRQLSQLKQGELWQGFGENFAYVDMQLLPDGITK